MFNVSDLFSLGADGQGDVIPPGTDSGSAVVVGTQADNQHILVVMASGIYNVHKATCYNQCYSCDGATSFTVQADPFGVPVSGQAAESLVAQWCSGSQYDLTGQSTWTSSNTSVATIPNPGQVQGESVGSFIASAGTSSEPLCTNCYPYGCPLVGGGSGQASGTVTPTITGSGSNSGSSSDLWYFDGASPPGYSTTITLTSSGGPSTTWGVSELSDQVNLSSTTGQQITVQSTGTHFSSQAGDVQITATVNGVASSPYSITTHEPYQLVKGAIILNCDATYGYLDHLNYTIEDQMGLSMPQPIPINEQWESGNILDYSGTNWRQGHAGSYTTLADSPAGFADEIGGENVALPPNPAAVCVPGNGMTKVDHWSQSWYVGSLTNGDGGLVQTDILQKFTDHAEHDSILTGSQLQ